MESRRSHPRRAAGRACLAAGLALAACAGWTAWRIWTFDGSSAGHADAAIVLGHSLWNGAPSPAFEARILHAVGLYRTGRVSRVIFTGGRAAGDAVSLAEAARDFAVRRGVPADAILVERWSRTTVENLAFARDLGAAQGLRSFIVVSEPLHLRRAMRIARGLGLDARPSAAPALRPARLSERLWFLRREVYYYLQYVLVTRFLPAPALAARQPGGASAQGRQAGGGR